MQDIRHIRLARVADYDTLVELWERSVRATHDFLTEADIGALRPLVREALSDDALELWVLAERADVPVGFMGLAEHDIAALFLEPAHRGQGAGRRLVTHAQQLRRGPLTVDVNEQNPPAPGLHEAAGRGGFNRPP